MPITPLLRKLEQYGPLTDEEKDLLQRAPLDVRKYKARDEIVRQGDRPTESCLVVDGLAFRFKLLPNGKRQILSFHVPGDFCDLHSFVLKSMDHGIGAAGTCTVAMVPHEVIQDITDKYPRLSRALMWDLAIDGAVFREWMVGMGRRTAYERLAHLLCEVFVRLRAVGLADCDECEFPITQNEIGDALGLSTVHVNRILQELRREGLIVFKNKRVTIPDLDRLKEAVGFDPAYLYVRGGAAGAA